MARWRWLLLTALVAACGGKSGKHAVPEAMAGTGGIAGAGAGGLVSGAAGSGGRAQASSGNGGTAQAGTGGDGMAQAGAGGTTTYVPSDPLVTPEGDGSLTGGSVEGGLGDGWDLCGDRRGFRLERESDDASDGEQFLLFDSSLACLTDDDCPSGPDAPALTIWPMTSFKAGETKHLYFDIVNLATAAPSGVLTISSRATSMQPCAGDAHLAKMSLADLATTSDWETRCVTFTLSAPLNYFGVSVTGETFRVGLDTFRFGPPCRT
jgi:hypothetical protein